MVCESISYHDWFKLNNSKSIFDEDTFLNPSPKETVGLPRDRAPKSPSNSPISTFQMGKSLNTKRFFKWLLNGQGYFTLLPRNHDVSPPDSQKGGCSQWRAPGQKNLEEENELSLIRTEFTKKKFLITNSHVILYHSTWTAFEIGWYKLTWILVILSGTFFATQYMENNMKRKRRMRKRKEKSKMHSPPKPLENCFPRPKKHTHSSGKKRWPWQWLIGLWSFCPDQKGLTFALPCPALPRRKKLLPQTSLEKISESNHL